MKTNRRGFLGGIVAGALASVTRIKGEEKCSPSLELILNNPNLFHFSANEGHDGFVWLNNVEQKYITEWVCSPHKGKSVLGAVRKAILDSDGNLSTDSSGLVFEWIIGTVRWEPRTIDLSHYEDDSLETSLAP